MSFQECKQFPAGSRLQAICNGTANLPFRKINAYRERWGLAALTEDQVVAYIPPPVTYYTRTPRPPRPPHTSQARRQIAPVAGQATGRRRPCSSCGGRKKRQMLKPDGHGPGSRLLEIFETAGVPHCQECIDAAAQMDAWGVEGCHKHLAKIVQEILPRARQWLAESHPWAHKLLSMTGAKDTALRLAVRERVLQAIAKAQ